MQQQIHPVFIGADIGTQGVRVMAVDGHGDVLSSRSQRFEWVSSREEQSPQEWWSTLLLCLKQAAADLKQLDMTDAIQAISVTATSGTMIALDSSFHPLGAALMYSDPRSHLEARACNEAEVAGESQGYHTFTSSSGLPKIIWYTRSFPEQSSKIRLWAHAADYIIGKLSGVWGVTDYSNSLKSGYSLEASRWPSYIADTFHLPASWFPKVLPPGTVIGRLDLQVAKQTGFPGTVKVVLGMTDGCASQIASGAVKPGDWNTTIGTTMVIKGVTRNRLVDPHGRLYSHKHPQGYWMPGGASNTGGDWIAAEYGDEELEALNHHAESLVPTPWISYPLQQAGERFPFISDKARGFDSPGLNRIQRFASRMEGVAYLEKLSYEIIEQLSGETISRIFTAGGASNSRTWLRIRSCVMQKPIYKMKHAEAAVGAAILAASGTYFSHLEEANRNMTQLEHVTKPLSDQRFERYVANYDRFKEQLQENGYL